MSFGGFAGLYKLYLLRLFCIFIEKSLIIAKLFVIIHINFITARVSVCAEILKNSVKNIFEKGIPFSCLPANMNILTVKTAVSSAE